MLLITEAKKKKIMFPTQDVQTRAASGGERRMRSNPFAFLQFKYSGDTDGDLHGFILRQQKPLPGPTHAQTPCFSPMDELNVPQQCRTTTPTKNLPSLPLPTAPRGQNAAGKRHYLFDVLMDVLGCLLGQLGFTCAGDEKKRLVLNPAGPPL